MDYMYFDRIVAVYVSICISFRARKKGLKSDISYIKLRLCHDSHLGLTGWAQSRNKVARSFICDYYITGKDKESKDWERGVTKVTQGKSAEVAPVLWYWRHGVSLGGCWVINKIAPKWQSCRINWFLLKQKKRGGGGDGWQWPVGSTHRYLMYMLQLDVMAGWMALDKREGRFDLLMTGLPQRAPMTFMNPFP